MVVLFLVVRGYVWWWCINKRAMCTGRSRSVRILCDGGGGDDDGRAGCGCVCVVEYEGWLRSSVAVIGMAMRPSVIIIAAPTHTHPHKILTWRTMLLLWEANSTCCDWLTWCGYDDEMASQPKEMLPSNLTTYKS